MPPSQLKRLKASLREQGIVGPQQSKKQKKQNSKDGATKDKRVHRTVTLQGIREQFNPFEVKAPARGNKFDVTSNKTIGGRVTKGVTGRPSVTKGLGEETRRKTLLVEMHRRNKIGGIKDRRFGENDPTMTPEERALERFTREKQIDLRKGSLFDLEDDEDEGGLTHFGQSLALDERNVVDDFNEPDVVFSDDGNHPSAEKAVSRKRRRSSASGTSENEDARPDDEEPLPQRRKTKTEVMKEVIAKSKLHKYERQQAKEDDDDLRAELDKGLPDLFALMRGRQPNPPSPPSLKSDTVTGMNPDREALLNGKDRAQADKEYDERLRQLIFDRRAQPTERTMTEEEKALEDAKRLEDLEAKRIRRMKGEQESSDEEAEVDSRGRDLKADEDVGADDAETFGLGTGITNGAVSKVLDVEDEDDFLIEEDLVARDTEASLSDDDSQPNQSASEAAESDDEQEFVHGLVSKNDLSRSDFGLTKSDGDLGDRISNGAASHLAFTYPCPQTHEEFLETTREIATIDIPIVIQRIRALYHPKLHADNKAKLGAFSGVLIDHIAWLVNQPSHPPFAVLETLIRHIHSLAKSHPEEVGRTFRAHLKSLHENRPTSPMPGDLIILTAIGSIFPTSDHFHPVVTPAILSTARYLGQKLPQSLSDLAMGTYLGTLCLQYQRLSNRFIPETLNYTLNALCILAPVKPGRLDAYFPHHEPVSSVRLQSSLKTTERPLRFWDILPPSGKQENSVAQLGVALLRAQLGNLDAMLEVWVGKSAFVEAFSAAPKILQHLSGKACAAALPTSITTTIHHLATKFQSHLQQARLARRPLLLHHHRPLAIKTSIPKFEESYNPDRHYDPDRDRAELSKLKAEHKRERKGALRELRKDASFIARESLREKKERDREYEKKYKRLVAEIQGEEGREAKNYEREKRARRGKR